MDEPITIRLYEDASRNAERHTGGHTPTDVSGWLYDVGENIGLVDDFGGYLLGAISHIDPTIHNDSDGARYRVATVILKD